MSITSVGNVGIGARGPNAKLEVVSDSQNATSTPTPDSQIVVKCSNASGAVGTGGGITFAQRYFSGAGDLIATGGIFGARLGGTDGSYGGGLLFKTTASGGNSMSDRMVITRDGNIGVGTNNPFAKLHVNGDAGSLNVTTGDYTHYIYRGAYSPQVLGGAIANNFGGASIYATDDIATNGSLVSTTRLMTASDERIKRDIVDVQDDEALQLLRLIEPKKYKYKDTFKNGDEEVYGFIAQQISNVFPEA